MTLRYVDWIEYATLLKRLLEEIRAYNFDSIVAIGRGGSIIAAYLASKAGIPTLLPIFVQHKADGELRLVAGKQCDVTTLNGRLLVVDDLLLHGKAMRFVLNMLPKNTMAKTMTMFCRKESGFKPDFVGAYIDKSNEQIMFPYDLP